MLPLLLLPAGILLEHSGLDQLLIGPFFDAPTGKWPYHKSQWLTSDILQTGGKNFVVVIAAGIFLVFVLSFLSIVSSRFTKELPISWSPALPVPPWSPCFVFPGIPLVCSPNGISYFFKLFRTVPFRLSD